MSDNPFLSGPKTSNPFLAGPTDPLAHYRAAVAAAVKIKGPEGAKAATAARQALTVASAKLHHVGQFAPVNHDPQYQIAHLSPDQVAQHLIATGHTPEQAAFSTNDQTPDQRTVQSLNDVSGKISELAKAGAHKVFGDGNLADLPGPLGVLGGLIPPDKQNAVVEGAAGMASYPAQVPSQLAASTINLTSPDSQPLTRLGAAAEIPMELAVGADILNPANAAKNAFEGVTNAIKTGGRGVKLIGRSKQFGLDTARIMDKAERSATAVRPNILPRITNEAEPIPKPIQAEPQAQEIQHQESGPTQNPSTQKPVAPMDTGHPVDSPMPDDRNYVGGYNAALEGQRKTLGLPEHTPDGESVDSMIAKAHEGKLFQKTTAIAQDALTTDKPFSGPQQIAVTARISQLDEELRQARDAEVAAQGTDGWNVADNHLSGLETEQRLLLQADEKAGASWSNSGRARQIEAANDITESGLYRQMRKGLKANKQDRELNPDELRIIAQDAQQWRDTQTEAIQAKVNKIKKDLPRTAFKKENILAEREQIHAEIDRIMKEGFAKANNVGQVIYESGRFSYALGKLAISHIKEGAATIEEAIRLAISDAASHGITATRDDVLNDIHELTPVPVKRTDLQNQITRLTNQIRRTAKAIAENESKQTKESKATEHLNAQIVTLERQSEDGSYTAEQKQAISTQLEELRKRRDAALRNAKYVSTGASRTTRRGRVALKYIKDNASVDIGTIKDTPNGKVRTLPLNPTGDAAQLQRLNKKLDELKIQLRDLPPGKVKVVKGASREVELANLKVKNLRNEIRHRYANAGLSKARVFFRELGATPRALLATADLSGTLRQGMMMTVSHPGIAAKAFGKAARAMVDPAYASMIEDGLKARQYHLEGETAGLYLSPMDAGDEQFASHFSENIPGFGAIVRGSERHFGTYLNVLRTSIFDQGVIAGATEAELKPLANAVNIFSGRGSLPGNWNSAAGELATAFFSPRFAVSRIQAPLQLVNSAVWHSPVARREVVRTWAATIAAGVGTLTLAKARGLDVTLDPESPDFGKIRDGDTVIDIWAGMAQPVRLFLRIANQTENYWANNESPKYGKAAGDLVTDFLKGKAAPAIGMLHILGTGKTLQGHEVPREEMPAQLIPLVGKDIWDVWHDDQSGMGTKALGTAGAILGVGTQSYPEKTGKVKLRKRK